MWKIFLTFVFHRFLLFAIAIITINAKISPQNSGRVIRPFQSQSVLLHKFMERVEEGSEVRALSVLNQQPVGKMFELTQDPFLWISRFVSFTLQINSVYSVLIVSNLLLLLFLWELNTLGSRLALPEVASGAGILTVLWMTSYELSLGSNLSLSCFLVTMLFRTAIDSQWFFAGIGLGLLALNDRIAIGIAPLLIYLFWYFQRFNPASEVLKKGVFFLAPVIIALVLKWKYYQDVWLFVQGSAFVNVITAIKTGSISHWPLAQNNFGQTISLLIFLAGAISAGVVNSSFIHRLLPIVIFIVVLAFSSYSTLASRLLIAGICFEGITASLSGIFLRLIQLALIIMSCYEIVSLF